MLRDELDSEIEIESDPMGGSEDLSNAPLNDSQD
jgi:hypothetical protein